MPGLQFENLPVQQTREIKGQLQGQWQIEAQALNKSWFSNRGQFETAKAKLNAKYQQMELKALTGLQQQQQEQQRVQQLIKHGTESIGREEEAALRMNLRPEAERLVFPPAPAPYSISQLSSKAMTESIDYFADAAQDTPGLEWGPPKKTKQGLIDQYLQWRELADYDIINPRRQQQLDRRWDISMAEDKRFDKWWLNKEKHQPIAEIKALRTRGDIGKIMRGRITGAEGVTPISESIAKEKPRFSIPTEPLTSGMQIAQALTQRRPAIAVPGQKPIRQRNKRTGQERVSYDGGRTWKTIG